MKFDDFGLSPELMSAIQDAGYETPTPIQVEAIPHALKGRDVLGIAQTGTGKTAGFTLPMIERLSKGRARARMPRSLVICPTRELAAQVAENFEKYGKNHKLTMALLIGGVSFGDQNAKLDRGVDVLIATPGRLLDHFERGKLLLTGVQILVVDEADRMLDMGFIPDIERIFKLTPFTRQTLFFSATMPPEIQRLTDMFLQAPVRIEVAPPATTAATVDQKLVFVPSTDEKVKREVLRKLLKSCEIKNGLIFCNRKRTVDIVAKSLARHGFDAAAIHGDLPQAYRTQTLDRFRAGTLKLLVASDVAARGLDIPDCDHVFNFDVPIHAEDYVHRIGRTGRAGRAGAAYMLATRRDEKFLDAIRKTIGRDIPRHELDGLAALATTEEFPAEDRSRGARSASRDDRRRSRRAAPRDHAQAKEERRPQQRDKETRQSSSCANEPCENIAAKIEESDKSSTRRAGIVGLGDHVPAFLTRPALGEAKHAKETALDT